MLCRSLPVEDYNPRPTCVRLTLQVTKTAMKQKRTVSVIDIFAGPGGLGDGFSQYHGQSIEFDVAASVEMTEVACETLRHRKAFLLAREAGDRPTLNTLLARRAIKPSKRKSVTESLSKNLKATIEPKVHRAELGKGSTTDDVIKTIKRKGLGKDSVLLGGPPCQAYSMAGRVKNLSNPSYSSEADKRNFLYQEYLTVLTAIKPAVFVMENVRGLLSAKVGGEKIFPRVIRDLQDPGSVTKTLKSPKYKIYSLVKQGEVGSIPSSDYLVKAEQFGIPQARHRVILLGVREDIGKIPRHLRRVDSVVSVESAIGDLPKILPKISSGPSGPKDIEKVLHENLSLLRKEAMRYGYLELMSTLDYEVESQFSKYEVAEELVQNDLGFFDHASRPHMPSDLLRYLFVASWTKTYRQVPRSKDFIFPSLKPAHKNWETGKFADRFKCAPCELPSNTITSHISKDGHSFIHYDPSQSRSLSVREAARIQTFEDTSFFEGPRTAQYHQVGNAVPSLLSKQIAEIVEELLR